MLNVIYLSFFFNLSKIERKLSFLAGRSADRPAAGGQMNPCRRGPPALAGVDIVFGAALVRRRK
jgi:hypothetical protein